jgi:hypothetical protein
MTGIICVPVPCFGCSKAISLLLIVFWAWVLVDCIKNEPAGTADKYIWLAVIVLAPVFGAALYVFIRRPQRIARHGK